MKKKIQSKLLLPCLIDALYLANLTKASLKPLSRIEYPITEELSRHIDILGLISDKIVQFAHNGQPVEIIIISAHQDRIDEAKAIFHNQPVVLDAKAFRAWGRLLGFPQCCVGFFVNENTRHAPNNFSPEDQSLLFHWACPNCSETKGMLPSYRKVWEETKLQLEVGGDAIPSSRHTSRAQR